MESILVIWFISCRMKREWWAYLSIPLFDTVTLQSSLERALDIIKKQEVLEGSMTGLTNVFTNCVQAMLMELANGPLLQREDGIQELEIGMRVMALEGAMEDLVEPWAFLGLLGMELPGGIRWKGRSEESWRLFWKLNG
ncbi:hypothetical protein BCR33DRAFT_418602 [Rhizoclosmatium globosum]|uniref:Uncharacterized protein n=1 Tax=Rhizoclosmatium globosum TaxID=329046 RepID=A0A1Y2BWJ9_9FUNG|nr:hypothetical protein BCR33DRAFT_418602 [Rhizoclosmatium globosum]|eukprot:ORY39131.1 hypothetical protein BCR33DRAFT_418602 [Rhizoclosmatium globosum]